MTYSIVPRPVPAARKTVIYVLFILLHLFVGKCIILTLSLALTSAPRSNNNLTIDSCPYQAAR